MSADERVEALAVRFAATLNEHQVCRIVRSVMPNGTCTWSCGIEVQGGLDGASVSDRHYAAALLASGVVAQPATVDEADTLSPDARALADELAADWPESIAAGADSIAGAVCSSDWLAARAAAPARDGLAEAVRGLAEEWQERWDEGRAGNDPVTRFLHLDAAASKLRAILAEHTAHPPCNDPDCREHGVAAFNRAQSERYEKYPREEARS